MTDVWERDASARLGLIRDALLDGLTQGDNEKFYTDPDATLYAVWDILTTTGARGGEGS